MISAGVMAGGSGARLWLLSGGKDPKQSLDLIGEATRLQSTITHLMGLDISSIMIRFNEEFRALIAEQQRQISRSGSRLAELFGRNTVPTIARAGVAPMSGPLLLVLPANQVNCGNGAPVRVINKDAAMEKQGKLVTSLGAVSNEVFIECGYIKKGRGMKGGFTIEESVAKPLRGMANQHFQSDLHTASYLK